jgi:hypothetical protein
MRRGELARRLISEGEDPFRMFAALVWPGRDWAEDARLASAMHQDAGTGASGSSAARASGC